METQIVLAAFNARYAHSAFGARWLLANLGELRSQARLVEFDLKVRPRVAAEKILAHNPRLVAIGCYIWNIDLATRVAALLRRLRPGLKIVLGGPEISHETEEQEIFRYADCVICGEGELEFPRCCRRLLEGEGFPEDGRIVRAEPVDLERVELPYDCYTDEDIAHRAVYVEAARGCPFRCEYCMSSLDSAVRRFPARRLFPALEKLIGRGARVFRFIDRTFNLDEAFAVQVLEFFLERHRPGMMLHFEVVPNRLPDGLLAAVKRCPPGMLQFEVGIQTFNPEVARRVSRPLDIRAIEANLHRLRRETAVHIHADLIAGLPGEEMVGFGAGFDRLLALEPQEIQLGILKRLRGAPIARHSREWKMVYSPHAPYEILQTSLIPFADMQRLARFARYWDIVANSGRFARTAPLLWEGAPSPFAAFMAWSDWLYARTGATANLHLVRLARLLLEFLVRERGMERERVAAVLLEDYRSGNRTDLPGFLKESADSSGPSPRGNGATARQARHRATGRNLPPS